jgi:spore coat protein U-like protein
MPGSHDAHHEIGAPFFETFFVQTERSGMKTLVTLSAVLLMLLGPLPAAAQSAPGRCDVTASGLNFGGYDVFALSPTDTTGTISVTCTVPPGHPQGPQTVTISLSPGGSGSFIQRRMQLLGGDTYQLNYNLYTNPGASSIWGDGSGGSQTLTNMVDRDNPWHATIFGRIPPGQNVRIGQYSDSITVTIEW